MSNLLSSSNEAGWSELQQVFFKKISIMFITVQCLQMSPEVNQMLVQSSEDFGKILSQTLNNETSKILEMQENIGNLYSIFYAYKQYVNVLQ